MIYITGVSNPDVIAAAQEHAIGIMLQPDNHYARLRDQYPSGWAVDNGCFAKGAAFALAAFLRWVARLARRPDGCRFVVAPDVVADARATWARSAPVLPIIRGMGLPAAFVAQDGLEDMQVPWDAFDALFIGGSTDWKLSPQATMIVREAKMRGRWVHMGRVNSQKRFLTALGMGCDSCDGTYIKFHQQKNLPNVVRWLDVATKVERRQAA